MEPIKVRTDISFGVESPVQDKKGVTKANSDITTSGRSKSLPPEKTALNRSTFRDVINRIDEKIGSNLDKIGHEFLAFGTLFASASEVSKEDFSGTATAAIFHNLQLDERKPDLLGKLGEHIVDGKKDNFRDRLVGSFFEKGLDINTMSLLDQEADVIYDAITDEYHFNQADDPEAVALVIDKHILGNKEGQLKDYWKREFPLKPSEESQATVKKRSASEILHSLVDASTFLAIHSFGVP